MSKKSTKPLHRLISQRELLDFKSIFNHNAKIYKSLLLSKRRIFLKELEYNSQGNVNYEDGHLFIEKEKRYINITDEEYQNFEFPPMFPHEKVTSTLVHATGDYCPIAKTNYKFLIILTDFGRLIFYDYLKHRIAYTFNLPVDKYKFKRLEWNRENHMFFTAGIEREGGEERIRGRRGKNHVLAVFEVDPIRFHSILEVDSNNFGYKSVSNIGIINDLLFIWDSQPHQIIAFNFDELYRKTTFVEPYKPYEGTNSTHILQLTMRIQEPVTSLFNLKGNFLVVGFTGLPYHLFATPDSPKNNFILMSVKKPHLVPILNGCSLTRPEMGTEICIESIHGFFHVEESGTFYRFERDKMISYRLKRRHNSDESEFVMNWENDLWKNTVEHVKNDRLLYRMVKYIVEQDDLKKFLYNSEDEDSIRDKEKTGVIRNGPNRSRSYMHDQPSTSYSQNRPSQIRYTDGADPVDVGVRRSSARIRERRDRAVHHNDTGNAVHHNDARNKVPEDRRGKAVYEMLTTVRKRIRTHPIHNTLDSILKSPFMIIREVMLECCLNMLIVSAACDLSSLLGNPRSPYIMRVPMVAMLLLLDNNTGEILKIIPLHGDIYDSAATDISLEDHLLIYGQKLRTNKSQYNVFKMREIGLLDKEELAKMDEKILGDRKRNWSFEQMDNYDQEDVVQEMYDEDFDPAEPDPEYNPFDRSYRGLRSNRRRRD